MIHGEQTCHKLYFTSITPRTNIITPRTNIINHKNRGKPLAETQLHKEASSREQQTQTIHIKNKQNFFSHSYFISSLQQTFSATPSRTVSATPFSYVLVHRTNNRND